MTTSMNYGYKELQTAYNRSMGRALMYSTLLVLMLVGSYHLAMFLQREDSTHARPGTITIVEWDKLPLPQHIGTLENIPISTPSVKPSYGIPIPVPDGTIIPDQPFAPPTDVPAMAGTMGDGQGNDNTILVIPPEADPEPNVFRAFEDEPVALLNPTPAYPELAMRADIEGTVWVKMLVMKDGTVKKAMVEKSNANILNDAALEAARRWVFRPALMNHRPVAVWVSIPFRFHLK